jgi:hypothetical protein
LIRGVLRQSGATFGTAGGRAAVIDTALRISAAYPPLRLLNRTSGLSPARI